MITTRNVACLAPGHISLRLKATGSVYKVYGYVFFVEETNMVKLQPADLRRAPVMEVLQDNVASIEVNFDND